MIESPVCVNFVDGDLNVVAPLTTLQSFERIYRVDDIP